MFYKKGVLRNFAKFTGKYLCRSPFFNKVTCLRPATLLKKRFWHRCFPVWLLLEIHFVPKTLVSKIWLVSCSLEACNSIKKEFVVQVFSCEFCKTFKQTYSVEYFEMIASGKALWKLLTQMKPICPGAVRTMQQRP